ncbi:MAG TPA: GMC family oxidoreductase, partial [Bryobacteraceae bacterium]|nr:GMC family oxidoreductase [Bryobacteraceae bacterium]
GKRVALLERGRRQRFSETGHDELRSQRTTVLGNAFGPDDRESVREVADAAGRTRRVLPSEGAYNNVATCVGGGTFSYGAMAWRYFERDFKMKSTYGSPANSTLEDWPITYQDLEPFYTKAEWEIGVSGKAGANSLEPPRSKPYPMPALPYNREASLLARAASRLNWHPFPIPMAINSVPYQGRSACIACPHCVGFACEVEAKNSTAVTVIPRAVATKLCDLRTGAIAKRIVVNEQGKATAVEYFQNGQLYTQPAKLVVVSCSATESPRLLFNSATKLFSRGLGNRNDWVGRNLQGHAYAGAAGIFEEEEFDGTGPAARIACCDFSHGLPNGLKGGGMMANEFIRLPYLFARQGLPPDAPRWGLEHKQFVRKYYKRTVSIKAPAQEMPVFESRVELAADLKDSWGIPTLRLSGHRHPHDLEVAHFMASKCEQWLREAGATKTWTSLPGMGLSGGQHQAGTCRMGNDPKTSVVDRHCRIHDMDNVYVVDGSVHVNNGGFNPSLTIQAIAYWASAAMVKNWPG